MPKSNNKTMPKKELILQAAKKIFAEKGFNGATTAEIARLAGVAEGTIYRHFKSKKDLLLCITTPLVINSLEEVLKEFQGKTNEEVLRAILKNRIGLIKENISLVKIIIIEGQYHPELRTYLYQGVLLKAIKLIEEYINNQIMLGVFREDINPQIAVRTLVGAVGGFIIWKDFFLDGKDDILTEDKMIDQLLEVFLKGMIKR